VRFCGDLFAEKYGHFGPMILVTISIVGANYSEEALAGILRGSDGTLWDFMGILMAVSAH